MAYDYSPSDGHCIESVSKGPWSRRYRCSFKAKVEREGKGYCAIHDPVKVKERADEREAAYEAKSALDSRRRALGYLGGRACKALQRLHEVVELGLDINLYDGGDEVREILKAARSVGWKYE